MNIKRYVVGERFSAEISYFFFFTYFFVTTLIDATTDQRLVGQ
jgi:hypothetical protein